jgi:hypothetical protein
MEIKVVLLLALIGAGPQILAQSAGKFIATSDMTTARSWHTATLLNDGKVLIAGGQGGNGPAVASAEIYDPSTRTFTPTGSMTAPRYSHTATLLMNGMVLIAGGYDSRTDFGLATSELYNPVTGTFIATGNMATALEEPNATLLADGRVAIGGTDNVQLYDPITGTFAMVSGPPRLLCCLFGRTATLLTDGSVLFAIPGYGFPAAGLRYDPASGAFSSDNEFGAYYGHAASLLMNGKVLISGGGDADADIGDVLYRSELYDPARNTFDWATNMSECRWRHTSTLLPDGTVLIAGGDVLHRYDVSNYCLDLSDASPGRAELYDPGAGTFSPTDSMTTPRERHSATLLDDGTVLIAGGLNLAGSLATAETYQPAVLVAGPRLLSSDYGNGQGAILHANTPQIASPDNPAAVGEALEIYATGLIEKSAIPPQVSIGGRAAEVLYFGQTAGYAGLNQINVRVPAGIASGPTVPVRWTYIGRQSNEVTIGVR